MLGALSLLLNGGGLQQIRVITTELNKALDGNESAVRDLLGQLNTFVGTLDDQKDTIFTALDSVDRLTKTLNANKRIIEQTLDTMPQALRDPEERADEVRHAADQPVESRLGGDPGHHRDPAEPDRRAEVAGARARAADRRRLGSAAVAEDRAARSRSRSGRRSRPSRATTPTCMRTST